MSVDRAGTRPGGDFRLLDWYRVDVTNQTAAQTVTVFLRRLRDGDEQAREPLFAAIYDELRTLARRQLARFRPDQTLNATVLVHELYLKLGQHQRLDLNDRRHLFAVAATAMRQIAVDYARSRRRVKRGGNEMPVSLDDLVGGVALEASGADAVVAIDQALGRLAEVDPRLARVVELRFFGGLSVEETAEVLAVSTPTVKRDTRLAKAFLQRQLGATD